MLTISRVQADGIGAGGSVYLPGSTKIQEQSLADMQEVRLHKVYNEVFEAHSSRLVANLHDS